LRAKKLAQVNVSDEHRTRTLHVTGLSL